MPEVSTLGLVLTAAILLGSAGLARALGLGLSRALITAGVRSALQLLALGIALGWIFQSRSPIWMGLAIFSMTVVATHTALKRVPFRYRGILLHCFMAIAFASWLLGAYAIGILLPGTSWSDPAVVLPLVGLLLGNCLSGISLGLSHWVRELKNHPEKIEFWLAHGATRWEAIQREFRDSLKTAMTPVLNSMSVAGIVSLPGMMTGQLLAGADPKGAVRYQIGIMFLVAIGTLGGTLLAVLLGFLSLFNSKHQFLPHRLEALK